jgi:SOS-response transcriptional repressor LexA
MDCLINNYLLCSIYYEHLTDKAIKLIMSYLAEKLKTLMRQHNISETELSRITKVGQPVIHRMASGCTENPKVLTLLPIAKHFDITVYDLMNSKALPTLTQKENQTPKLEIPIISFNNIMHWLQSNTQSDATTSKITLCRLVSEQAFATIIPDSSMRPTIPEDTMAVIDPQHTPANLDYILVYRKHSGHCTIKQLLIDGSERFLKPHNKDFSIQPLRDSDTIIGPIVQTRLDLKD